MIAHKIIIENIYYKIEELQNNTETLDNELTYCFIGKSQDYRKTDLTSTLFRRI